MYSASLLLLEWTWVSLTWMVSMVWLMMYMYGTSISVMAVNDKIWWTSHSSFCVQVMNVNFTIHNMQLIIHGSKWWRERWMMWGEIWWVNKSISSKKIRERPHCLSETAKQREGRLRKQKHGARYVANTAEQTHNITDQRHYRMEQEMEQQQEVRFDGKCVSRREQLVKETSKRGTSDWWYIARGLLISEATNWWSPDQPFISQCIPRII